MSIYVIIVVTVIVIGIISDRVPDLFNLTYMISSIDIIADINIVVIAITDCINVMICCIVIISIIKPYDIISNATKTVPLLFIITHSNVTIYYITLIIISVDIMI